MRDDTALRRTEALEAHRSAAMSRSLTLSFALVTLLGLTACGGDSHEALADESVSLMQDLGNTLAKITDKASAEAHVGELKTIVSKMSEVQARLEAMGEPSGEAEAELAEKYESRMGAAMQAMGQQMMRISANPEIMQVVDPVLQKIGQ
jgi:hypothetical protein